MSKHTVDELLLEYGTLENVVAVAQLEGPNDLAVEIAVELLRRRTCLSGTLGFGALLGHLVQSCDADTWRRLTDALVSSKPTDGDVEAVSTLTWVLSRREERVARDLTRRIIEWLTGERRPGLSRIVARVFYADTDAPEDAPESVQLARWLLDVGSTELVRGELGPVVLHRVLRVANVAAPELRAAALGLVLRLDRPATLFADWLRGSPGIAAVWTAAEGWPEVPDEFVAEILSHLGGVLRPLSASTCLSPLVPSENRPRVRAAILRVLARGDIRLPVLRDAWRYAVGRPPPEAPLRLTATTLRVAWTELRATAVEGRKDTRVVEAWFKLLTRAYLSIYGLHQPEVGHLDGRTIADDASWDDRAPGIRSALEEVMGEATTAPTQSARAVLERYRQATAARLAFALLPPRSSSPASRPCTISVEDATEQMNEIARVTDWSSAQLGLDLGRLLAGRTVRVVSCEELNAIEPELVIDVGIKEIRIADIGITRLLEAGVDRDSALTLVALYFVHELLHVGQGIQSKGIVDRVRGIGSERSLLELDLAADHLAARAVAHAVPRWDIDLLKDRTCTGASLFPATLAHTNGSIERKSLRLLGLYVDAGVRRHGSFGDAAAGPGFALVELPVVEGSAIIYWCDRVPRVLALSGELSKDDVTAARTLAASASDGRVSNANEIARRLLAGARAPTQRTQ